MVGTGRHQVSIVETGRNTEAKEDMQAFDWRMRQADIQKVEETGRRPVATRDRAAGSGSEATGHGRLKQTGSQS